MSKKCGRPNCPNRVRRQGLCAGHYKVVPSGYVDAQPAQARYQLLRDRGLSVQQIARLSGLHRDTLRFMGSWGCGRVRVETFDRLMAVRVPDGWQPTRVKLPAIGTQRRIKALAAGGHSLGFIGTELGVSQQAVACWLRHKHVSANTAAMVAALFDRLQLVPGPSIRARNHAQRKGWHVAMAWDEDTIDDPSALPNLGDRIHVTAKERIAELQELGVTDHTAIAERLGIKAASVERQISRSAA